MQVSCTEPNFEELIPSKMVRSIAKTYEKKQDKIILLS